MAASAQDELAESERPGAAAVKPSDRRSRARNFRILGLLISLLALGLVVRSVDLATTAQILLRADLWPLTLIPFVIIIQTLLRAERWRWLLDSGGTPASVPIRRVIPPMLIGYLANGLLPARLGEAVRAIVLARREQLSSSLVLGSAVLERLLDTVALALIVSAGAILAGAPDWLVLTALLISAGGLAIVVELATIGVEPLLRLGEAVTQRLPGRRMSRRLLEAAAHFGRGIRVRDRRRATLAAFLISLPCWLLEVLSFYLASLALGLNIGLSGALLVAGFATLGTAIPAAPGYVGTFELAATTVAIALGVPSSSALAYALLVHVLIFAPITIAGLVSLSIVGLRFDQLVEVATPDSGS
jgi:hypothetical protein